VTFEWVLDTAHGADYFRRWHREKDKSGGLLIHKSSHHFDLVNWWLPTLRLGSSPPGDAFYGAENADRRGWPRGRSAVRTTVSTRRSSSTSVQILGSRSCYLDQEQYDGYLRDKDVFDTGISAEGQHGR